MRFKFRLWGLVISSLLFVSSALANVVGTLNGEAGVSPSGAATYTIPIDVTPSLSGLQPSISLNYNSQLIYPRIIEDISSIDASYGSLGNQWSLGFGSVISRCQTTIEIDGLVDPVDYDGNDKLCIDGNRMILIEGIYGSSNSKYQIENVNGEYILARGEISGFPEYFELVKRNGKRLFFGKTENSRQYFKNNIKKWNLSRIFDSSGEVNYTYKKDENFLLKKISYEDKSIDFNYEYLNGWEVLKEIRTDTLAYNIEYDLLEVSNKPKIIKIEKCSKEGRCFNPMMVDWVESSTEDYSFQRSIWAIKKFGYRAGGWRTDKHLRMLADIDGDGIDDIIGFGGNGVDTALANGGGTYGRYQRAINAFGSNKSAGQWSIGRHPRFMSDVNGDGLADIVGFASSGVYTAISLGNGKFGHYKKARGSFGYSAGGWRTDKHPRMLADIDGDGIDDIIGFGGNGVDTALANGDGTYGRYQRAINAFGSNKSAGQWSIGRHPRFMSDVNGDGLADIIGFASSGVYTAISLGNGKFGSYKKAIGAFGYSAGGWRTDKHPRMLADINGDGLADIIGFAGNGVNTALAKGDGTFYKYKRGVNSFGSNSVAGSWSISKHPRMMADINGDGLADIIGFASAGVNTALSLGDGRFAQPKRSYNSFGYGSTWRNKNHPRMVRDVDGDGLADIVGFASDGVLISKSEYKHTFVKKIIHSGTNFIEFNYSYNTSENVYLNSKILVGREYSSALRPKLLLSSIGTPIDRKIYSYRDFRTTLNGRQSLGFKVREVLSASSNIKQVTEYTQDYKNRIFGSVIKSETVLPNSVVISSTQSEWESNKTAQVEGNTYLINLRKSTTQNRDISGKLISDEIVTYCYTDYIGCINESYDEFGNAKYIKSTVQDRLNGNTYYTETNNEYWPLNSFATANDYYTSQMKKVTVTKGGSNRDSKTRVAEFNEYDAKGKLKKETVEPGANQLVTQYEYETSGYGRITKKTVSGANIATRSSSITYDASNPYLSSSRNALNQTTVTKLSPKWGTILSKTNANGLTVYNTYDDFGRKSSETLPDGSKVVYSYDWCSSSSCPAGAVYSHTATTTDGLSENYSKTFFDALQRKVAVSTLGFNGEEIRVDYLYDELGRQYKTSLPYFVGTGSAVYKENTGYDLLNRVTEVTHPNSSTSSIAYDGLETTYTNAKNQQKVILKNALGETILSTDDDYKQLSLTYDALGNLISTRDEAGNSVIMNYDIRGNKTSMNDPDKGQWQYEYNVLGQLVLQTDAKNQSTCMVYDVLGRMTKRIDQYLAGNSNHSSRAANALSGCAGDGFNTQISHWVYDTSPVKGVGKLHAVSGANGYAKTFTYDALGRVSNKAITIGSKTHNVGKTYYANTSKVNAMIYPTFNGSEFKLRNFYKPTGALYKTQDISGGRIGEVYWQATGMNASGQLTNFVLGNGVTTTNTYNEHTGFIEEIDSLKAGITGIQYLDYRYDEIGNLEHRKDFIKGLSEQFGYDELNRLTGSTITGTNAQGTAFREDEVSSYDNNGLGNIQSKTGVGIYSYGQPNAACSVNFAGPHAVTSITGGSTQAATSYCYDENGNMVSGAGRNISYTAFGKPSLMSKGSNRVEFVYGPNRTRIQRVDNNKTTTTYVEGIYEELETSGGLTGKYYIGNYAVVTKDASSVNTNYLHRDHLGSVDAITDANGVPVAGQQMSFDAWGKRRQERWNAMSTLELFNFNAQITNRGYTNHEQVDSMGLIHMNGRVYDPILARFISADPIIQAPLDMQSYNRYSYVRNNPLGYIDPTGYSWLSKELDRWGEDIRYELKHFDKSVIQKHGDVIASMAISAAFCYAGDATSCMSTILIAGGTTATLKTPAGQRTVKYFAKNVLEKIGVDEEHSYFLSYLIVSAGVNMAYQSGWDYVAGTPEINATEIQPTEAEKASIESSEFYANRGDDFQDDFLETGTRSPGSKLYELKNGDELVGYLGTSPMDVPLTGGSMTHTAAVLKDSSGNYFNSLNSLSDGGTNIYALTGTCHQMTNSAITSAGYAGTVQTMSGVSVGWTGSLTMAVYGRGMGSQLPVAIWNEL